MIETLARTWTGAIPLFALAATPLLTLPAQAGVIHDTTWMTDEQSYTHTIQSGIAGPGTIFDINVAANFMVQGGPHDITSVTGDFRSNNPWGGEGVLVEIFADVGNAPSNDPAAQFFAAEGSGLTVGTFDEFLWGTNGTRFTIDLNGAGITLGEGSWWLSIVPVHENQATSQTYGWIRQQGLQPGGEWHTRNGHIAHGNDFGGQWGWTDWVSLSDSPLPGSLFPPGDPAFQVTGALIPGPGALALLAIGGLGLRSRRRS